MNKTVYLHREPDGCCLGIAFCDQDVTVVETGIEIQYEDTPLLADISRLCGVHFFREGQGPDISLYGVPYLWVFASDGESGLFAGTSDRKDGPVYYISRDRSVFLAAESFPDFFDRMVLDPGWRQKHLPGGPWPSLPEDPAGREALADVFHLPSPPPDELRVPDELPQVFASRAEAEAVFPIQDIWTVLRQKKEPRFQVHPMMSPADREGRALVHYAAWQETYTGLMPEDVLSAHTLEHCRKMAKAPRGETYVALDRENGDRVVGFVCYQQKARDIASVPDAAEITALYVLRAFQGLGLGRMLLERCIQSLYRDKAVLFVLKGNENAIRFYEHMGFRLTGHETRSHNGALAELEMCRSTE